MILIGLAGYRSAADFECAGAAIKAAARSTVIPQYKGFIGEHVNMSASGYLFAVRCDVGIVFTSIQG